jgi:hypothetical protein
LEESSHKSEDEDMLQNKYQRIKNTFRLLIEEAPFLIDDKTFDKCEGRPLKEQFSY